MNILFRAKRTDNNEWIQGFYIQGGLQANSMIAEHAIQTYGHYPIEIDVDTLSQYREDIDAFDGDWIKAKTRSTPVREVEGVLKLDELEFVIEQNDKDFPIIAFSNIDISTVFVTESNIYDSPELIK